MLLTNVKKLSLIVMLAVVLAGGNSANADRRGFVWTYEYMTMPKGHAELEYYLTHKIPDMHNYSNKNSWEHMVEFEYGVTDKFDVAIYQKWKQTNTATEDKFEYKGSKARVRYRLGEKGSNFLDTLLYAEYIRPDSSNEAEIFEGKLILAKDIGDCTVAYNQILKVGLNGKGGNENKFAFGLSNEFSPVLKLGLEASGSYTEDKYYIGPTISVANERFWWGLGALRGLNDRSDDFQLRFIAGFPF